jgi:sigma-B regulation protein RsbU (phosphoserine phosphatase)
MKKRKKMRTFAKRLTGRIMIVLLVVMGPASFILYEMTSSVVEEEEMDLYESKLNVSVQKVRRVLSDVYVATRNQVPMIEESLDNPDRMYTLVERLIRFNPRIRSCGITFVADYYPQKGRWYCPYAVRRDSNKVEVKNVGSADFDYLTAEWFTEALKAKEGYWSKPYYEGNDTVTPLVSYMAPIRDKQGRTVAVLGADVSLDWFSDVLIKMTKKTTHVRNTNPTDNKRHETRKSKYRIGTPYSFVIDGKGTYIAHTDKKLILKGNFLEETASYPDTLANYYCRQMIAGKKGFYPNHDEDNKNTESLIIRDQSVYLFYAPIEFTDWSMALILPAFDIKGLGSFVGIILLLLISLALLVVYFVGRRIIQKTARPLHQLATSAGEVAKGHFDTPLPIIKHNNEIRMLRDSFEDMQHSLTKYVDELKTTTASKAAIENELKVAHDIQMSMLPKDFPPYPERDDIDIAASLTPAKEVGGDLFDFYIHDGKLFFCIGDVSGKGVPASLVMAVTCSLFRNVSARVSEPNEILCTLNDALVMNNETNMFVTAFVGVLDLKTGLLRYCNAGHDAPLLIGDGVDMLPCDPNLPLGVLSGWTFTSQEAVINSQTVIFLYTDGLTEAEDMSHAQFGDQRVISVAEQVLADGEHVPSTIISLMSQAVHTFVGNAEQSDDLSMLAIKYKK